MSNCKKFAFISGLTLAPLVAVAQAAPEEASFDWFTGRDLVLSSPDESIRLFPSIYLNGVLGDSTADEVGELFVGAHDPDESGADLQSIEFGGLLEIGDFLSGTAVYNLSLDEDDEFEGEFEEAFASAHTADRSLEARGGRFLNRFGFFNETHLHGWSTIDTPLVIGSFLGDHGLRSEGGEFNYLFSPNRQVQSLLSVSFGQAVEHDHEHGHDHEEGEDHGEEEHGDHDAHEEGEALLYNDTFFTARAETRYIHNDFHRFIPSVSASFGDNEGGGDTFVGGLGLRYEWFENGFEPGGKRLIWTTELFLRDAEATLGEHSDHEEEHGGEEEHEEEHHGEGESFDETSFGFYTELVYTPLERFDVGGRIGYIEGIESDGDRWRFSPVATAWLNPERSVGIRAQYNADVLEDETEHGFWLQLNLSWGSHRH